MVSRTLTCGLRHVPDPGAGGEAGAPRDGGVLEERGTPGRDAVLLAGEGVLEVGLRLQRLRQRRSERGVGPGGDEGYAGRGEVRDHLRVGGGEVDAEALDVAERRDGRLGGGLAGREVADRLGPLLAPAAGVDHHLVDRFEARVRDDGRGAVDDGVDRDARRLGWVEVRAERASKPATTTSAGTTTSGSPASAAEA